jgi:hypothetical protein
MTRKILESCPSCGGQLLITEVHCTRCATQVRAQYRPCDFCSLSEEQSTFLRLFLTSRGNLSEVEKRLGVSYPTVRAKLDEVIARVNALERPETQPGAQGSQPNVPHVPLDEAMRARVGEVRAKVEEVRARVEGEAAEVRRTSSSRRALLDAVARGEISPAEAAGRLKEIGEA